MSSAVSLPNHTFTGQALSSKRLTSIVHILSPETDNCPSWISGRERMTVENISWSISTKECCRPRRGLNPQPPGLQSDGASNWATEADAVGINKFDRVASPEIVAFTIRQCWLSMFTNRKLKKNDTQCAKIAFIPYANSDGQSHYICMVRRCSNSLQPTYWASFLSGLCLHNTSVIILTLKTGHQCESSYKINNAGYGQERWLRQIRIS